MRTGARLGAPAWHPDEDDDARARYGWRVLSVTALGVMLCFINASTLNVALPQVARDLGASPAQASWFLLSYMLVLTVLILVFGRLSDLFGQRRLYLAGLAVLTLASVGCGLATTPQMLVVFRCLQAVGAAAVITNTTALLTEAFPTRLLGIGLGLNATISAAAQGLGPVLGGVIVSTAGWRSIFLLNLPLGLLALHWARRTLRPGVPAPVERFDGLGALLSMLGLGSMVYALSMGGPQGWRSRDVIAGALVSVLALLAFWWSQHRRRHPLVDPDLFADRERGTAYVCVLLICMAQTSSLLLMSLFLQGVQGLDAFQAGLGVAPVPLGMMVAAPVAGRLLGRHSALRLSAAGLVLTAAGLALLAVLLSGGIARWQLGGGLLLIGLGSGLFLTSNNSGIMASVQPQRRGIANAVRSTLQHTGLVVGAAMAMSIAIAPLSPLSQQAAYAGHLSRSSPADIAAFIGGCRTALWVLWLLCMAGIALSLHTRQLVRR
ncbi:DHA2 family efflux MFS transporter permease subunit [Pseudorhodoferax sp. Leaf267]|uniref:DHA2 family efflux MFS transporter permease subunit n=1 Tax=Pseudorhodoferax sp. Leaf267 TaxID=1736316 RepID=UPI001F1A24B1|nr:DHA2 family efflux MFS transporter permease subunit [Pseudorhodoferax sp. Leaf267]